MRSIQRLMRAITLVGQLGFSIISPPLVLTFLAHLAVTRLGWGVWIIVAAIVVGIITAFCSARQILMKYARPTRGETPPTSFNTHE